MRLLGFPGEFLPSKVLGVAKNYRAHAAEMGGTVPREPKFFLKPSSSLLEDGGIVILPACSSKVEYEVELAVVIGCRCHKLPNEEEAWSAILGYSVIVDVTARDLQAEARRDGMPWTVAKGFDTFAPLGPCLVPARKLDPRSLAIWLAVNGQMRQTGNTADMVFSVPRLVLAISQVMTLEPMDVIATGTPEGVGPLVAGDHVEAGIEGIGTLRFLVAGE
jgi:2-keto-4-pentenoate hydratase/2-oxohepta-3-ene-1,7-dioic acid hydratase in catechol pathway